MLASTPPWAANVGRSPGNAISQVRKAEDVSNLARTGKAHEAIARTTMELRRVNMTPKGQTTQADDDSAGREGAAARGGDHGG